MESKRNETFDSLIFRKNTIRENWSSRQKIIEEATRQGARPPPLGAPYPLVGPSRLPRPTSYSYISLRTLKTSNIKIDRVFCRRKPL